jgi:hypothetical protein
VDFESFLQIDCFQWLRVAYFNACLWVITANGNWLGLTVWNIPWNSHGLVGGLASGGTYFDGDAARRVAIEAINLRASRKAKTGAKATAGPSTPLRSAQDDCTLGYGTYERFVQ